MRSYHTDIAAFVAATDGKWVDNLLSRFSVPGVESGRQGIARRVSIVGMLHIALTRRLALELSIPVDAALALATRLLRSTEARATLSPTLEIRLQREEFELEVEALVAEAVETNAPARRGRPPRQTPGSTSVNQ